MYSLHLTDDQYQALLTKLEAPHRLTKSDERQLEDIRIEMRQLLPFRFQATGLLRLKTSNYTPQQLTQFKKDWEQHINSSSILFMPHESCKCK